MRSVRFRDVLNWVMLALRELTGWLLIVAGFICFYLVFLYTIDSSTTQKPLAICVWTIIGIFVFRGGIHLLKVAIAAQVCQQTQDQLYPATTPSPALPLPRQTVTQAYGRRPGS
jgi:hypothetical protein